MLPARTLVLYMPPAMPQLLLAQGESEPRAMEVAAPLQPAVRAEVGKTMLAVTMKTMNGETKMTTYNLMTIPLY